MVNFIEQSKGLAKNPLGIIALFVSLIYGFACLVLSTNASNLNGASERLPLIWFIIVFPIVILVAFIFLVSKHHEKLYSPKDYGSADSFLRTLEGAKKFEPIQIEIAKTDSHNTDNIERFLKRTEQINIEKEPFSKEINENGKMASAFFRDYLYRSADSPYIEKIEAVSYEVQAAEYFIFSINFAREFLKDKHNKSNEIIIIHVTPDNKGILNMIAIGKSIIETDPVNFSKMIIKHIDALAKKNLKEE